MAKPVSNLESLPPEAQAQIIAWLDVEPRRKVAERIAKLAPEGFGIRTHVTTLARFYTRHLANERLADLELAKSLAPDADGDPIHAATQNLTRDWAFQIATKPRRNLESFRSLSRWLLQLRQIQQRDQELAIQSDRLAFDRERFELDVARIVLLHQAGLEKIGSDRSLNDEQKIDEARSLIFRRPISELPPRLAPKP